MSAEAKSDLPPIILPYHYEEFSKVDIRTIPQPGDLLQVIDPGGNKALQWARDRDELVEVVDSDFSTKQIQPELWMDAGCVRYRMTTEESSREYPGTRAGCYLHRFALVKRKNADEEDKKLLEELNNLIVVQ